jgi:hypothetical protein
LLHACSPAAFAADDGQVLCDASCVSKLESMPAVTTPSGLQYKDIVVGTGGRSSYSSSSCRAVSNLHTHVHVC